jgi:hypothetical protein
MPIPTVTSSDIMLRILLDKQVEDFDDWISVEDLLPLLPTIDRHRSDEARILPRSVQRDIEFLERHRLVKFRPANPHVRLTPLGVYTALLFDMPSDERPKPDSEGC